MNNNKKIAEIVQRYTRGEDTVRIARDFGVTSETVRKWLEKAGVPRRSLSERNRMYTYRHDAFKYWTPEAAYWAGLLMADGSVSNRGLVSLELNVKDRELVIGLSEFLEYTGPLADRTRISKAGTVSSMVSLRVTAKDLAQQLLEWGVCPRKTYIGSVPPLNGVDCHFYRGLFDGDGYFHRRKDNGRPQAGLCGNPAVVDSFRDWCWTTFREVGSLTRKKKFHIVMFAGEKAFKFGHAIYSPCGPRLKRKEEVFRSCLK